MASSTNILNMNVDNNLLGKQFASFAALKRFLILYQRRNRIHLHKTRGYKLNSIYLEDKYRCMSDEDKEALIYFNIIYICVIGGQHKEGSSRTSPQGCPFVIEVGLSEDGKALVIQKFENVHNHENNEAIVETLPLLQQRLLTTAEEQELEAMLKLQPSKIVGKELASQELDNTVSRTSKAFVRKRNKELEHGDEGEIPKKYLLRNRNS